MEAKCSSEIMVHFQGTTWRYNPVGRALSSIIFFIKILEEGGRGLF
jgi:hypothetical protein